MVRASPEHGSGSPKRLTHGFIISISALMTRLAKQASHFSINLKAAKPKSIKNNKEYIHNSNISSRSIPPSPKSALSARPKQVITSISNKASTVINRKKNGEDKDDVCGGDGGIWQRAILMGDKCQPLDFSGVIYYDSSGKQLDEVPLRSPRASPLPGYLARKQEG